MPVANLRQLSGSPLQLLMDSAAVLPEYHSNEPRGMADPARRLFLLEISQKMDLDGRQTGVARAR
jgi:hypothetical protein